MSFFKPISFLNMEESSREPSIPNLSGVQLRRRFSPFGTIERHLPLGVHLTPLLFIRISVLTADFAVYDVEGGWWVVMVDGGSIATGYAERPSYSEVRGLSEG